VYSKEVVDNISKTENFWLFITTQVAYYELLAFLFLTNFISLLITFSRKKLQEWRKCSNFVEKIGGKWYGK
jgi:hypothetical protein